jgi:hypothetical protein
MKRLRSSDIRAEAIRELEAIDATLSGTGAPPQDAALVELVRELRASRPRPREQFARMLDAKVAQGFESDLTRESRGGRTGSSQPEAPRGIVRRSPLLRPAIGVGLAIAVAVAVALPLALSGAGHGRGTVQAPPRPSGQSAVATPAPQATVEAGPLRAPLIKGQEQAAPVRRASSPPPASADTASPRQVERTATLDVGVAPSSIESTSQQVFTLVSAFNGYVRQSNVSSGGSAQGGASFDLRIPSSTLSGAIAALSHLGHVRSENNTTNDVTEQFNSLRRSLGDLQAERASLLKQLAGVSDPQQAASLRARLQVVERRISQLQGAIGALRIRINYTSLALTLTAETQLGSKQGDLTPGGAARDAAQILQAALAVLVIGVAALLPLGALALAAWILTAGTRRRLREQALDTS